MSLFALIYMLLSYVIGSLSSTRLTNLFLPKQSDETLSPSRIKTLFIILLDMLKGTLPVWAGYYLGFSQFELGMVALCACLGHIFPLFAKFKGGKGVATALGAIAPISWGVCFSMFGTWTIVFFLTGYSSLSAVVTALAVPFYVWYFKPEFTFPVALVCCLLIYRHHENIQRLWRNQENKTWTMRKK